MNKNQKAKNTGDITSWIDKLVLTQRMKKATDGPEESSRAQHDLQGIKMKLQRRKSDSKQQATENQMTERSRTCEFFSKKGVSTKVLTFSPINVV